MSSIAYLATGKELGGLFSVPATPRWQSSSAEVNTVSVAVRLPDETELSEDLSPQQQRLVEKIRALSVNGIAPSTGDCKALSKQANRLFGGWPSACFAAGVTPMAQRFAWMKAGRESGARVRPHSVPPPSGCEEAARLIVLAVRFALRHNIGGPSSGEKLLKLMCAMYSEGV